MDSEIFFSLNQNGEMDDRNDYVDWADEYQIYRNLEKKLECLGEIVLC